MNKPTPISNPLPPALQKKYQGFTVLNDGEFITTFLATMKSRKQNPSRKVVIKHLSLAQIDEWKAQELFEREANVLQTLNHDNIPQLLDTYTVPESGGYGLVQEYIPGKTLEEWVESGRHFSEKETVAIGIQICLILKYLHELNPPLIHRDVKPSNIILNQKGKVFLIDFGAIKQGISHLVQDTMGSTIVGTYGYMPLEQFSRKAFPASDLYSLGATMVYMLTGKAPGDFEKKQMRLQIRGHLKVTERLMTLLERLLEPMAEHRYPNAALLVEDLGLHLQLLNKISNSPLTMALHRKPKLAMAFKSTLVLVWFWGVLMLTQVTARYPWFSSSAMIYSLPGWAIVLPPLFLWRYWFLPDKPNPPLMLSGLALSTGMIGLLVTLIQLPMVNPVLLGLSVLGLLGGGLGGWKAMQP